MDEVLISKKDLLESTGISYGQLYRWKRKNLIPEEWFIKKSSYTGQETYFPRDKILTRISKIKDMKDDIPLDEIANVFSPEIQNIVLSKQQLIDKNIVSKESIDIFVDITKYEKNIFAYNEILQIYIMGNALKSGEISIQEASTIVNAVADKYSFFEKQGCDVILIRKFGISICILVQFDTMLQIEKGAKLVYKVNTNKCCEEIKIKIV